MCRRVCVSLSARVFAIVDVKFRLQEWNSITTERKLCQYLNNLNLYLVFIKENTAIICVLESFNVINKDHTFWFE